MKILNWNYEITFIIIRKHNNKYYLNDYTLFVCFLLKEFVIKKNATITFSRVVHFPVEILLLLINHKIDKSYAILLCQVQMIQYKNRMLECLYSGEKKIFLHCRSSERQCCLKVWKLSWFSKDILQTWCF